MSDKKDLLGALGGKGKDDDEKKGLADALKGKGDDKDQQGLLDALKGKPVPGDEKGQKMLDDLASQRQETKQSALDALKGQSKGQDEKSSLAAALGGKGDEKKGVKGTLAGTKSGAAAGAASTSLSETDTAAVTAKVSELKSQFTSMIDRVRLSAIGREITNLESRIKGLPGEIEAARSKGYAFRSYLENKANVLNEQWGEVNDEIKNWVDKEAQELRADLDEAEKFVETLDAQTAVSAATQQIAGRLEGIMQRLNAKVESAEQNIQGLYDSLEREFHQTQRQLTEINWIVEQWEEKSFDPQGSEAVFLAAEAEWDDGKDKPEGMLFLTDKRLIFEQNEKTGKRFGMFGGKHTQGVLWESPVTAVEGVEAENRGMLGGKDMLNLRLGAGATYAAITVEVKGSADNKFWMKQIQRMAKGDANDERAIEPDPEMIERLRNAPTDCHVCGAVLPQITSGETQVACKYCGGVVRI